MSPYSLTLTKDDIKAIDWAGGRYHWSTALFHLDEGINELAEHEAWEIVEACERDTEGGHSYFPCLSSDSNLAAELYRLIEEVV
jgi:hypothetical protein